MTSVASRWLETKSLWVFLLSLTLPVAAQTSTPEPNEQGRTVLQTTVRRVVVDVTVTDLKGNAVPGLTKGDFAVSEDGKPQTILSFEANGTKPEMDYVPYSLPKLPPNTFANLPDTPEKGPLYVLLYDMVNMDDPNQMNSPEDHHNQIIARQEMMKFIQSKPEGSRFAVFVRSDGLHLVEGFTADKTKLYAALDPKHPRPHMPAIFLMGPNYGRGNRLSTLDALHRISVYLDGLPGRKNLIWFSSVFPLSLFAQAGDGPNFQEATRATLDLMAHNQIAIFPVDARGVSTQDSHLQLPDREANGRVAGGSAPPSTPTQGTSGVTTLNSRGGGGTATQSDPAVSNSMNIMDEVAHETGGRAFYGTNNLASELTAATKSGQMYYTLTYAPTNRNFDGDPRSIHVEVAKKGYQLAYRRTYYGLASPEAVAMQSSPLEVASIAERKRSSIHEEPAMDLLSANMQHGAPVAHQLVFLVQAQAKGTPLMATMQQMTQLAVEPAYFKPRRGSGEPKALASVPLQTDVVNFEIPTRQFNGESSLDLHVAAAAYNAEGDMMNVTVSVAKKDVRTASAAAGGRGQARFYRVEQELAVPKGAVTLRFAVWDASTNRIGAMEVPLPLEGATAQAAGSTAGSH